MTSLLRIILVFPLFSILVGCNLTVINEGGGLVSSTDQLIQCGDTCTHSYKTTTQVTLTVTPEEGYTFIGWQGACSGTSECIVTIGSTSGNQSVTAVFEKQIPTNIMAAAGGFNTCAELKQGIECWGENFDGASRVPAALGKVSKLVGGGGIPGGGTIWNSTICAINDGALACWGYLEPSQPTLENVTDVSVGGHHACHIAENTVSCWGREHKVDASVFIPPDDLIAPEKVFSGVGHNCVIDQGKVACWGINDAGQLDVPEAITNPVELALGEFHTCALADEGIVCWGGNYDRHGNQINQAVPPQLTHPRSIVAGMLFSCALADEGVVCWGSDYDGIISNQPSFINPTQVIAGSSHACALDQGKLKCWGANQRGQLFNPELSSIRDPRLLTFGGSLGCVSHADGITCWGGIDGKGFEAPEIFPIEFMDVYSGILACAVASGKVHCWGNNQQFFPQPDTLGTVTQVAVGATHICALTDRGLTCWGSNNYGQLDIPALVDPTQLWANANSTCAYDRGKTTCWGGNPASLNGMSLPGLQSLAFNDNGFACAITDSGNSCWGGGRYIRVPDMTNPTSLTVAYNTVNACAIDQGAVVCWPSIPLLPQGIVNATEVALGWGTNCVIDDRGVLCDGSAKFILPRAQD